MRRFLEHLRLHELWEGLRGLTLSRRLVLIGLLVGASSGAGAFFFNRLIELSAAVTLARLPGHLGAARVAGLLLFPALGALSGSLLIERYCPQARGHGVAEVTAALSKDGGRIPGEVAAVKLLASAATIGLGGSAGREGPIIQIGGAVGSSLGRLLRVPQQDLKTLAAAGAAAGLGASFGVPLAAVFFTMEVLLQDFVSEAFPAVVIASVAGAAAAGLLQGNSEFVSALAYRWHGPGDLAASAAVGLVCAPCGYMYMRLVESVEKSVPAGTTRARLLQPALGGFLTGAVALAFPEVLGTGQAVINAAVSGRLLGAKAASLAVAKTAATAATLGFGGSGGAFMPALFIGASTGGACGSMLAPLGVAMNPGALSLVGMACAVSSAYRAPVTAIVMALEMSKNYDVLLPVMLACAVAHLCLPAKRAEQPELESA